MGKILSSCLKLWARVGDDSLFRPQCEAFFLKRIFLWLQSYCLRSHCFVLFRGFWALVLGAGSLHRGSPVSLGAAAFAQPGLEAEGCCSLWIPIQGLPEVKARQSKAVLLGGLQGWGLGWGVKPHSLSLHPLPSSLVLPGHPAISFPGLCQWWG